MEIRIQLTFEDSTNRFRLVVDEKFCGTFAFDDVLVENIARRVSEYMLECRQTSVPF